MLKNKKEKNNKKSNLAIGATGIAATGLGAAYLLSRKKPTNITNTVKKTTNTPNLAPKPFQLGSNRPNIISKATDTKPFQPNSPNLSQLTTKPIDVSKNVSVPHNAPKNLTNVEKLISTNIDKSPVNLGVEKVIGGRKQTASIWDKVAEKISELPSVKQRRRGQQLLAGSKPPKGLLRPGYDLPDIDWDSPVEPITLENIAQKIRAKRQGLLGGIPNPKSLPMARVNVDVAVKGYQRRDGTFVSAYRKNIDKILREKRSKEFDNIAISGERIIDVGSNSTEKIYKTNTRETLAAKIREHITMKLYDDVDEVQAKTYTRPVIIESAETTIEKETNEKLKEVTRNKYRNASMRRERVHTLKRQADDLAKELEEKAQQTFSAKKQNFVERVNELGAKIKSYEPEFFEKRLSTDTFDLQLKELQTNLDKTLNDPFAPNYFDDSKEKIEFLKKQLTDEVQQIDAKGKKPQEFLDAVEKMYAEIDNLKKEYRSVLEKTYEANKDRVGLLQEQLKQEQAILQNLTETDITSEFLRRERNNLLFEINKRTNRQFFGRTSNVERSLNQLRSRVYNQRTTVRNKIKTQNENLDLTKYRNTLLNLASTLDSLPKTRRNLNRAQRRLLRQTESFPKTYKKLYGKLFADIENLHQFENEFMSRYKTVVKDIDENMTNVFSNKTFDEYMDEVSTSAEKVEVAHITFGENTKLVDNIYDPNEIVTRYIDLVNRVKDISDVDLKGTMTPFSKEIRNVDLNVIAQRKRVILQGGYIDGKKYGGVLEDLNINTDGRQIKNGLLNAYGERYIKMKSSVVDYNDAKLAKLAEEYITTKKRLLKNIDKSMSEITENIDYDTWRTNPELGKVLGKINDNVRKYNDDFATNDITTSFFNQRQKIYDVRSHLDEIGRVKPEFILQDGVIKFNGIKLTDVSSAELNKDAIAKIDLDYARVVGKTRSKRVTMANLYYNLDKAGINVEGSDTIFKRLRGGVDKLTENEKMFFNSLTKNEQIILQNFSNYRLDEHFQKYYYTNALSYVLRGNVRNVVMTEDVGKQLGFNTSVLDRIGEYLGRNKPVDLQRRKLKEVQTAIRDLQKLGGTDVRLTAFMEIDGEKVPFQNGLMGIENLPPILPGEQYRNRNFLVRKLQKILGVNENGMPLYNSRMARILSGADVSDRESLKKLLRDIENQYYAESDLNTLYMAAQMNSEYLRSYDSSLYLYNFTEKLQHLSEF